LPLESLKSLQLLRPTVYTIYLAVGSSCEFAPAPITRLPSASDSSSFRFLKWEEERMTTWPSVCVWGLHTVLLPLSRFRMCRQQQQGPEYLVKLWRLWNGSVIDGDQNCSFSTISESCLIALPLFRESRWAETEREGGTALICSQRVINRECPAKQMMIHGHPSLTTLQYVCVWAIYNIIWHRGREWWANQKFLALADVHLLAVRPKGEFRSSIHRPDRCEAPVSCPLFSVCVCVCVCIIDKTRRRMAPAKNVVVLLN
jgi:hypothetical protein